MAKFASIRVEGIESIISRLHQLPDKLQRKVLRPATEKAGTIVKKTAQRLVPIGKGTTPDGRSRKHLRKAIVRSRAKFYPGTGTVLVVVGAEKNEAPHAHLVHDGTKPHPITLGKPLVLNNVVLPAGFVIEHPGASKNEYLDTAVVNTRTQVQQKLRSEIVDGIEKQVNKLRSKK